MKSKLLLLAILLTTSANATTRFVDADRVRSSDHTKTWTPPAATDTLVGRSSTDTLTNKTIDGGSNTFTNVPLGSGVSGTLSASNGGTGQTSITNAFVSFFQSVTSALGDLVYGGASGTPTRLAGNTTATKKFLNQTGTGAVSAAPVWSQPACGDLSNAAASCSTDTTNAANLATGLVGLARGGTSADLSATGGTSQVLKQTTVGGAINVARLACSDLSNAATSCSTDATNASNISSGTLSVARATIVNQSLGTCNTAVTPDWSTGNSFTVTLTNGSACAFSFIGKASGQFITIHLYQPGSTGSATATWSSVLWAGGTAPTITTGASKHDVCTFAYNGTDTTGSCVQDVR